MKKHILHSWKQHLSLSDYETLLHFVENAKNDLPNEKVLILSGVGKNGKTTLLNEILFYIGIQNVHECNDARYMDFNNFTKNNFIIHGGIEHFKSKKRYTTQLLNVIENKKSVFSDTNKLDLVESNIFDKAIIITMKHIF